ncbi:MAG: hypothetical protein ISQ14_08500 [Verrucomicrobiae bacterium]|nr:hypothetical protein [Verrucomicrobiae bacterium]
MHPPRGLGVEGVLPSPGAVNGADYVAIFMLFLVFLIIAIAACFIWLASSHARERRRKRPRHHRLLPIDETGDSSLPYTALINLPQRWIAVQGVSPEAVVNALKIQNLSECGWAEGLAGAGQNRVFISPKIVNWTLIIGDGLPDSADDVDAAFRFLTRLSTDLGHVQYFSASRALGHHSWVKLYQGKIVRAFAWAGQTLWNQGPLSTAELKLGAICHDYLEDEHLTWREQQELSAKNLELIPSLAARWSIDPAAIDARKIAAYPGLIGEL